MIWRANCFNLHRFRTVQWKPCHWEWAQNVQDAFATLIVVHQCEHTPGLKVLYRLISHDGAKAIHPSTQCSSTCYEYTHICHYSPAVNYYISLFRFSHFQWLHQKNLVSGLEMFLEHVAFFHILGIVHPNWFSYFSEGWLGGSSTNQKLPEDTDIHDHCCCRHLLAASKVSPCSTCLRPTGIGSTLWRMHWTSSPRSPRFAAKIYRRTFQDGVVPEWLDLTRGCLSICFRFLNDFWGLEWSFLWEDWLQTLCISICTRTLNGGLSLPTLIKYLTVVVFGGRLILRRSGWSGIQLQLATYWKPEHFVAVPSIITCSE